MLAADLPTLIPASLQKARALVVARPPRAQRSTTDQQPQQHRPPLRPVQRALRDVPRRDAELLLGAVRHPDPAARRAPGRHPARRRGRDRAARARPRPARSSACSTATGVGDGTRLLEIGTGWGELAIRAARRGARVRTVTLSTEQLDLARARIAAAGVADRVQVDLRDYRAIEERAAYDAVVSVEMIEAVGHDFWPKYFQTLDRVLAPGGKVGIQAIVMPHDRMLATRARTPGSTSTSSRAASCRRSRRSSRSPATHTTLRVTERLSFGSHYAETLRRWDAAFGDARDAGPRARLRRDLRADVALLPGVLARGLRLRLPRRRADRARAMIADPAGRDGRAVRRRRAARPAAGLGRLGGRPGRTRRSSSCAARTPYGACFGTRASSAPRRPTSPASSRCTTTSARRSPTPSPWRRERGLGGRRPSPAALARAVRTPGRAGPARPAARAAGHPGADPRPAALQASRPVLDRPPLRLLQRLLRAAARRLDGLLVRRTSPATTRRTRVADAQRDKLDLVCRKLGLTDGMTPARRRLRLGLAVAARCRALRGAGHRRDDRGRAEAVHRRSDRRARAG